MLKPRIIPCLLLEGQGLVKTVQFKSPTYIGDPINAVRIFNTKQVHELVFLDITATSEKRPPRTDLIQKISDECRMPLTVGGGIRSLEDIRVLMNAGVEKVVINTYAFENPSFIKEAAREFGSQSIVVSIDAKKNSSGDFEVFVEGGTKSVSMSPLAAARLMQEMRAGEIMLNSIDRDGEMQGYDIELIRGVADQVDIPLIAAGGAGCVEDLAKAINEGGASAAAAGSLFVFHGPRRAVLINFPDQDTLAGITE